MATAEMNFDGLVGPTHNYAGLSFGNVASEQNQGAVSNPRAAALQGLSKMRALHAMGLHQGVIAPLARPDVRALHRLGFRGTDAEVIAQAATSEPELLRLCTSASSMWTANAATVAPSLDTVDGRVHITPANLVSRFHRSLEPSDTATMLRHVFSGDCFAHHDPLPSHGVLGDEGAANHTRLCRVHDEPGVHLFVYGRAQGGGPAPARYPARQTLEASRAVARLNAVADRAVFAQQAPAAIDAGVFHNDVISVGNEHVLLLHENTFVDQADVLDTLRKRLPELIVVEVPAASVDYAAAVRSYVFNSQLVTLSSGRMALVAPSAVEQVPSVREWLDQLVAGEHPVDELIIFDLQESMRNGGGPACLRLRVPLTDTERAQVNPGCVIDDARLTRLEAIVRSHYRDRLSPDDLRDPSLWESVQRALDAISAELQISGVYGFQDGQ